MRAFEIVSSSRGAHRCTEKAYYESYYDEIIIPEELCGVHYKATIHTNHDIAIKMCNAHFNCDIVIGMRHIFAMLTLSSRKCNAGTALKTD